MMAHRLLKSGLAWRLRNFAGNILSRLGLFCRGWDFFVADSGERGDTATRRRGGSLTAGRVGLILGMLR